MSGVSLPVTRPTGRALLVASPASRAAMLEALAQHGFGCTECDDPYAAMAELSRRPLVYRSAVLSLSSLYREELTIIPTIKRRFPHVEVWLTHTDGRQAALAEAMRLGADCLLAEDGLHRIAISGAAAVEEPTPLARVAAPEPLPVEPERSEPPAEPQPADVEPRPGEPILTADELRALLHEQPSVTTNGSEETSN